MRLLGCYEKHTAALEAAATDVTVTFLDAKHHADTVRLVRDVQRIFSNNGVTYSGFFGDAVLLGIKRCGGMLPWDDDSDDMIVLPEDLGVLLKCIGDLYENGFYVVRWRKAPMTVLSPWPFDPIQLVPPSVAPDDLQRAVDDPFVYFRIHRGKLVNGPTDLPFNAATVVGSLGTYSKGEETLRKFRVYAQPGQFQVVEAPDSAWIDLYKVTRFNVRAKEHGTLTTDECTQLFEAYAGQERSGTTTDAVEINGLEVTGVTRDEQNYLGLKLEGQEPVFCNMTTLDLVDSGQGAFMTTNGFSVDTPSFKAPLCLCSQKIECSGVTLQRTHLALLKMQYMQHQDTLIEDCVIRPPHTDEKRLAVHALCAIGVLKEDVQVSIRIPLESVRKGMVKHSEDVKAVISEVTRPPPPQRPQRPARGRRTSRWPCGRRPSPPSCLI